MIYAGINRFLHWFTTGLVIPVLVLMLVSKGVTLAQAGLVLACMSAVMVTLEVPSGVLSDLLGRKRIYLCALLISLLAYLVLLSVHGALWLGLVFALLGLARALASGSIESSFIDAWIEKRGKEKLPALLTAMNTGEAGGLAVGALLGGLLPQYWPRWFPGSNPFTGNILAQIATLAALFLITLPYRDTGGQAERQSLRQLLDAGKSALRGNPVIATLLFAGCAWGFAFNAIELYWQPRLQNLLGSGADSYWLYGSLSSAYFLMAIAGNWLITLVLARLKTNKLLLAGLLRAGFTLVLLLFSRQGSVPGFAALYLLLMFWNGMLSIPEASVFNSQVPAAQRASFLSLSSLAVQLGGIAGALVFSALVRHAGIPELWILAAGVFGLSALPVLRAARRPTVAADRT